MIVSKWKQIVLMLVLSLIASFAFSNDETAIYTDDASIEQNLQAALAPGLSFDFTSTTPIQFTPYQVELKGIGPDIIYSEERNTAAGAFFGAYENTWDYYQRRGSTLLNIKMVGGLLNNFTLQCSISSNEEYSIQTFRGSAIEGAYKIASQGDRNPLKSQGVAISGKDASLQCINGKYVIKTGNGDQYVFTNPAYDTSLNGRVSKRRIVAKLDYVTDIHGNTVNYYYQGLRTTKIQSSDGRIITIARNGYNNETTITSNDGRKWILLDKNDGSTKVELPNGLSNFYKLYSFADRDEYHVNSAYGASYKITVFDEKVERELSRLQVEATGQGFDDYIHTYELTNCFAVINGVKVNCEELSARAKYTFQWTVTKPELIEKLEIVRHYSNYDRSGYRKNVSYPVSQKLLEKICHLETDGQTSKCETFHYKTRRELEGGSVDNLSSRDIFELVKSVDISKDQQEFSTEYLEFNNFWQPTTILKKGDYEQVIKQTYDENVADGTWKLLNGSKLGHYKAGKFVDQKSVIFSYKKNRINKIDTDGVIESRVFYDNGMLDTLVSSNGTKTKYRDYYRGVPRNIVYAWGNQKDEYLESQTVNNNGLILSSTNAYGYTINRSYDNAMRLSSISMPQLNGNEIHNTSVKYYFSSDKFSSTPRYRKEERRGSFLKTTYYDGRGIVVKEVTEDTNLNNPYISIVNLKADSIGRIVFRSYPFAKLQIGGLRTSYDSLNRKIRVVDTTNNTSETISYLASNKVLYKNARGYQSISEFESTGSVLNKRLKSTRVYNSITPQDNLSSFTSFSYYPSGQISRITQSGKTKSNQDHNLSEQRIYDSRNLLCKVVRPEFGQTAYHYNDDGTLAWKAFKVSGSQSACDHGNVSQNAKTEYSYNALGQLNSISYPDNNENLSFEYYNGGATKKVTNSSSSWDYSINQLGYITNETLNIDGYAFAIDYTYDGHLNRDSITYPSGETVHYNNNSLGMPVSVNGFASNVKYHANGRPSSFKYGNGYEYALLLNKQQLPEVLEYKDVNNHKIVDLTYTYDKTKNIENIENAIDINRSVAMSYDGQNQLITATGVWGGARYEYDPFGNIISKSIGSQWYDYEYDYEKNLLVSVTSNAMPNKVFDYDEQGNISSDGLKMFSYNDAGHLLSVGSAYANRYDGYNKRVKKQGGGKTTYSVYNFSGQLLHEYTEDDDNLDYIYLSRVLIAKSGFFKTAVPQLSKSEYFPYGKSLTSNDSGVGFTGHIYDAESDLIYMQARYYDPVIGRFYSNDPVGWTPKNPVMSFNRYLYVNNNPYKYTDPNGQFLDAIVDIGFIAYDLYDMASNGVNATNSASLGANVAGLFIPGATGLGLAARAGDKGVDAANTLRRTCCFVAGTQVLTEDGYKNIEDVKLGEKLWAKNTETGEQDWKPVTKVFIEPDRGIFEIKLVADDGVEQKIQATDDHPFYVIGKGWKQTIELKVGDKIETDGNGAMEVASVIDEQRLDLTYNFTVADFHTYYVTKKNVLVHNCGGVWKSSRTDAIKMEHIFSAKHINKGIMDLGSKEDIIKGATNALQSADKSGGLLKDGTSTVITKMNGHTATVRAFFKGGELQSVNVFKGTTKREEKNVTDLR